MSLAVACWSIGCATQVNSPSQPVLFLSDPPGAEVWVDGRFYVMTPGKVRLSRLSSHRVRIEKVGYEAAAVELERGMSLWTLADIVCLPLVLKCISEDRNDGGFYVFDDEVHVTLTGLPEPDPSAPQKSRLESPSEFRFSTRVDSGTATSMPRPSTDSAPLPESDPVEPLPDPLSDPIAPPDPIVPPSGP